VIAASLFITILRNRHGMDECCLNRTTQW